MRCKQVERARYEADLAQRRSMHVDPANRLVADTLEAEWNGKLRALNETQEEYERLRLIDRKALDEAQKARVASLASDFRGCGKIRKRLIAKRSTWFVSCSRMSRCCNVT